MSYDILTQSGMTVSSACKEMTQQVLQRTAAQTCESETCEKTLWAYYNSFFLSRIVGHIVIIDDIKLSTKSLLI